MDFKNKTEDDGNKLCFACDNAFGGCEWARDFKPVRGWTAVPSETGYYISACPKYTPDKPHECYNTGVAIDLLGAMYRVAAKDYYHNLTRLSQCEGPLSSTELKSCKAEQRMLEDILPQLVIEKVRRMWRHEHRAHKRPFYQKRARCLDR